MRKEYSIQLLCEVLEASRSCYYAWRKEQTYRVTDKNKTMEKKVLDVFGEHKRRYGSRRIVAELRNQGISLSRYKAVKMLAGNGLKAIQPRSFVPKTTDSRHPYRISPNLLKESPAPAFPNQVWVGDITYIPMISGRFRYLSVWMDLFSRRIVGWDLQDHMRESLVTTSLQKAIRTRKVRAGLLIHSDRGGQYAGTQFRKILDACKMLQSMSDADNPYDNAYMESFFSRFKAELLEGGAFEDSEDSRTRIFEFIEMYYNPKRLHSSIGYLSPNEYEKKQ